jgi:hypothetical protein
MRMRPPWSAHRLALAAAAFATLTCGSDLDNVEVESDGRAMIPAGSVVDQLLGDLAFTGFDDIDVSQSQELENQGYTEDQIDSVHLESITLTISAPAGGDFDFLDQIAFFVEAEGEERVEIARLSPVPAGQTELDVPVADVELLPYVVAPAMTVTTEATGSAPDQDTTVDAHLVFDVDIDVSGAACSVGY